MSQTPYSPISHARSAAREANRVRAEYLLAVADGTLTPLEVAEVSCQYEYRALRRITLMRLLTAQRGVGKAHATVILAEMMACLKGTRLTDKDRSDLPDLTLAWLIDSRSAGRRWAAFNDALTRTRTPDAPWPGFPFSPRAQG